MDSKGQYTTTLFNSLNVDRYIGLLLHVPLCGNIIHLSLCPNYHRAPTSMCCYWLEVHDAFLISYLFPDHDVILVVAVVGVPQFTWKKTRHFFKGNIRNLKQPLLTKPVWVLFPSLQVTWRLNARKEIIQHL